MANFTITISNSLNVLGPGPSTCWNNFNWGSGYWGAGSNDLPCEIEKLIDNSLAPTCDISKEVERTIDNSLSATFEAISEGLTSGGWDYVFTRPSTDAEDRTNAQYQETSRPNTTWTSATAGGSSWSET